MTGPLVKLEGLEVSVRDADGRDKVIVRDITLEVRRGEVLALIGESGSGKSTIALSMLGYTRGACRISGAVSRSRTIASTALPSQSCAIARADCVLCGAERGGGLQSGVDADAAGDRTGAGPWADDAGQAEEKARGLFRALALPHPDTVGDRYPHQVSGGQLQRLMAAMALITDPALVIFDEPTTALDVTTQIEVLKAFKAVVRDLGTTAVYVSHDLAVVAQIADRICVLRQGMVQEQGRWRTFCCVPAMTIPDRWSPPPRRVFPPPPCPIIRAKRAIRLCSRCAMWWPVMAAPMPRAIRKCASSTASVSPSSEARCWA
jgi:peptide/nickel transport system ATP-binding protein